MTFRDAYPIFHTLAVKTFLLVENTTVRLILACSVLFQSCVPYFDQAVILHDQADIKTKLSNAAITPGSSPYKVSIVSVCV